MRKIFLLSIIFITTISTYSLEVIPTPTFLKTGEKEYSTKLLKNSPIVNKVSESEMKNEAYKIVFKDGGLQITTSSDAGLFYAKKSIEQIIFQSKNGVTKEFEIQDTPQIDYRVFMLDSGRQYQSVETIKNLLDLLSELKINTFHWHLTEGMGWRIPIKQFPKLTEVGSKVSNGLEQHGFYSEKEIKEIVKYASDRFIQIVPEIDLPGHSEAALTSYPQWCCEQKLPSIKEGFSDVIFCAGKEDSVSAIKQILKETALLFPGKYLHIGGDEAPKTKWEKCKDCQNRMKQEKIKNEHELHIALFNELAEYVLSLGKTPIMWNDPIRKGNKIKLNPNVIIQYWNMKWDRQYSGLKYILKTGNKIIYTPNKFSYLNFPTSPWRGYDKKRTTTEKYCYENIGFPYDDKDLYGIGCALWTDFNLTQDMLDERVFPRVYYLVEYMWNKKLPDIKFEDYNEKISILDNEFTRIYKK